MPAASAYGRADRNIRPVAMMTGTPASLEAAIAARVRGPKLDVLGDQRAVEIARERLDVTREVCGREASAARGGGDVRGDVRDLLLGQRPGERRHHALPVRDAVDDECGVGLRVVEVGTDRAGRACVGERVAAAAVRREDDLAGDRVALESRRGLGRGRLRRLGLRGLGRRRVVSVVSVVSVGVVSVGTLPSTVSGEAVVCPS